MLETINEVLSKIDGIVWGVPLMVLILSGGLYLTIRIGFLQTRKLPLALKWMVKNEEDGHGEVTSFGALCTGNDRNRKHCRSRNGDLCRRTGSIILDGDCSIPWNGD